MTQRGSVLPPRVSRALLLFVLPLPLLAETLGSLVKGELLDTLIAGGALAVLLFAGTLMRRGLLQEAVLGARRYVAQRPPPFKLLAAVLTGLGTGVVSALLVDGHNVFEAAGFGAAATIGALLLYGMDPRPKLSAENLAEAQRAELLAALGKAEEKVLAIEAANRRIFNDELSQRLLRVTDDAREILDLLASRPEQMRQARRFLNTYLDGAEQVARGYADTHTRARSAELETKFSTVLATIEATFREQRERLIADDLQDLDVKIEVLTTQLEREGL